ncbi:unnamed protein product [Cylicostephanus goldi]|uniref:Post-SET domain-containing protein n=1 Tax=Cylicostephanus goldi TaxID=71465 RepID=A0A3P6QXL5_CYLGO|nr:unnamed protein product [Cylicostephanus goldi]
MTQYNIGCPLPDCKCGAPNCTGSLGAVVHEKVEKAVPEVEVVPNDSEKQGKGKQKRKAASSLASPKKKRSSARSRQSTPASSTSSSSRSPYKGQKIKNGKDNLSRTQTRSRGCKVINGFKEPKPEVLEDEKLKRALLNGEALEKLSDAKPLLQKGNQEAANGWLLFLLSFQSDMLTYIPGLRKNHRRIAAELSSFNVIVS